MPGVAEDLIREFWRVCEQGDFNKLMVFFAEDAVLVDPVYGTFDGHAAIAGFMTQMTEVTGTSGTSFAVAEVAGDESTAWARWTFSGSGGEGIGASIFRIRDGLIVYEHDYTHTNEAP
jgi:ketosteroid isomerase-like protein